MPELRKDPISDRWVIISTERGKRPHDFKEGGAGTITSAKGCPFCSGNEDKTPPEISAVREKGTEPNKPGWSVRIVENKFPALQSEGEVHRCGTGIFDEITGIGRHEVIIETPKHGENLAEMDVAHIEKILWHTSTGLRSWSGTTGCDIFWSSRITGNSPGHRWNTHIHR